MSVYKFRKSILAPALGVNYALKPHLIPEQQWFNLERMKCYQGVVYGFPGWSNILDASTPFVTLCSLIAEFRQKAGTVKLVCGDVDNLYDYSTTTKLLTDKSGATTFAPTRDRPWSSTVYSDKIYVTNKVDGLYQWDGGAGNFTAVGTNKLWNIRVLQNHLCGFGLDANPFTFAWASEGTETFTAAATNDAGAFDVLESPDEAVGLEILNQGLIGYKQRSIHAFDYIGGRAIMGRRRMVSDVGLLGPYAIAAYSDHHIFMGDPPAFYRYNGGNSVDDTIGAPVNSKVFGELHPTLRNRCRALSLYNTREVMFFYPDTTATTGCNRVVIYNKEEQDWYGPFSLTNLVDYCTQAQIRITSTINSHAEIIDTVTAMIDSFGGAPLAYTGLFGTPTKLMDIGRSDDDDGTTFTRTAESGDIFVGRNCEDEHGGKLDFPHGSVFQIQQMNLEFEKILGTTFQMFLGTRMNLGESITWTGPYTITNTNTHVIEVPVRPPIARWHRVRFIMPNGVNAFLSGYQYLFSHAGVR